MVADIVVVVERAPPRRRLRYQMCQLRLPVRAQIMFAPHLVQACRLALIDTRHQLVPRLPNSQTNTVTVDLFDSSGNLEALEIEDAEILFARKIQLPMPGEQLLQTLISSTPWRSESVTLWGKTYPQPRLIAWYGDPGRSYSYSGIHQEPLPWTRDLSALRELIEQISGHAFNSVLLNYYRDQRDSMGMHSDDEPELGNRPVIASLSLGAERTLVVRHKTRSNLKPVRIRLPSGSLLIMKGLTQKFWKHGINKQVRLCGPRVNLTFRQILSDAR